MKKRIMFISSILVVFFVSEVNSLNNGQFLQSKTDNPYIPFSTNATTYSGKSFDTFEENNTMTDGSSLFYLQVIDNADDLHYNMLTQVGSGSDGTLFYETTDGDTLSSTATFVPELSNLSNGVFVYSFMDASKKADTISYFEYYFNSIDEGAAQMLSLGSPTGDTPHNIYYEDVNVDGESKESFSHYTPTTYPYIESYETDNDVFAIDGFDENGTLTFSIDVSNWNSSGSEPLTVQNTIGVTLVDEFEQDERYKYHQYDATLVSDNGGGNYTYEAKNLNESTLYKVQSINYSGLTIGNEGYNPDYQIDLEEELGIPVSNLEFSLEYPYIDSTAPDFLKIDTGSVTAKSIQFSLKIIDTSDGNFVKKLEANNNTMQVTLLDNDTNNFIQTDAEWIGKSDDETFLFKITGLNPKTSYELYSLDNTSLATEEDGNKDDTIYIQEELGLSQSEVTFKTKLNLILIITIVVASAVLIAAIILIYFLYKWIRVKLWKKRDILNFD